MCDPFAFYWLDVLDKVGVCSLFPNSLTTQPYPLRAWGMWQRCHCLPWNLKASCVAYGATERSIYTFYLSSPPCHGTQFLVYQLFDCHKFRCTEGGVHCMCCHCGHSTDDVGLPTLIPSEGTHRIGLSVPVASWFPSRCLSGNWNRCQNSWLPATLSRLYKSMTNLLTLFAVCKSDVSSSVILPFTFSVCPLLFLFLFFLPFFLSVFSVFLPLLYLYIFFCF